MSRNGWRAAFLTLTALVLGMELWAAFDHSDRTDPWTDLVVAYVPMEITYAAIGALCLWLPIHFWIRYRRQRDSRSRDDQPH